MNPRRAAIVGVLFVVIAVIYFAWPTIVDPAEVDYAGVTMLVALGGAMGMMAFVLVAGLRNN